MNTIEGLLPEQYMLDTNAAAPEKTNELGQNEFLSLMLAQLKHQDPFEPLENGEFVAQMAQFSTVAGIESMENSLNDMSESFAGNQLLQASSLIGRSALVATPNAYLGSEAGIEGLYRLPESTSTLSFDVLNAAGELVHHAEHSAKSAGLHPFQWDGTLKDGTRAPEGKYTLSVTYGDAEKTEQADILTENKIASLSLTKGDNTVMLETEEGNQVGLADIERLQ